MSAVAFLIELYEYCGFKFTDTAVFKRVFTHGNKTLNALILHHRLPPMPITDIVEVKSLNPYKMYTIKDWLSTKIQLTTVDFVRMEYNRDKFPKSYTFIGMCDYKNTANAYLSLEINYAEIFLYLWECAYGRISSLTAEIDKLRASNVELKLANIKLREELKYRK